MTVQCLGIYGGVELEFLSAETVAKYKLKVHCLLLKLISVFSAETTDENIFYCSLLALHPCLHRMRMLAAVLLLNKSLNIRLGHQL